ncbi:hypothetical protein PI124_g14012 [Phytophthora idaei]|nr:hypothetical protein PI126_g12814 [Phytophthora idaei]KAG3241099.1 hypothetical protein PI124_g14012 [Phytophthora idaei]
MAFSKTYSPILLSYFNEVVAAVKFRTTCHGFKKPWQGVRFKINPEAPKRYSSVMRLSYVVLATVLVLAASTEAVVTTTNSVNPAIEDHRFLRVQKNASRRFWLA